MDTMVTIESDKPKTAIVLWRSSELYCTLTLFNCIFVRLCIVAVRANENDVMCSKLFV